MFFGEDAEESKDHQLRTSTVDVPTQANNVLKVRYDICDTWKFQLMFARRFVAFGPFSPTIFPPHLPREFPAPSAYSIAGHDAR